MTYLLILLFSFNLKAEVIVETGNIYEDNNYKVDSGDAPLIHELKIYNKYFDAVVKKKKLFEIRKNDRNFKSGDILLLVEVDINKMYTKRSVEAKISYVLRNDSDRPKFGLAPGFAILSIYVDLDSYIPF